VVVRDLVKFVKPTILLIQETKTKFVETIRNWESLDVVEEYLRGA
jgi:hypothetical protein